MRIAVVDRFPAQRLQGRVGALLLVVPATDRQLKKRLVGCRVDEPLPGAGAEGGLEQQSAVAFDLCGARAAPVNRVGELAGLLVADRLVPGDQQPTACSSTGRAARPECPKR